MSLNLSCSCGYQGVASAEEAQELIWCPQCRKVLHQPRSYSAAQGRQFTTGGAPLAPRPRPTPRSPGGSGGGAGGRLAGGIALAVVFGVLRAACTSGSYHDTDYSPNYTPPRFDPVIVQQPPQIDWNQFQPVGPAPFNPGPGDDNVPIIKGDEIILKGADGREIRIPLKDPGPADNPFGKPFPGGPEGP
jgi:hypothetical protein